jgi:hypothetical protein
VIRVRRCQHRRPKKTRTECATRRIFKVVGLFETYKVLPPEAGSANLAISMSDLGRIDVAFDYSVVGTVTPVCDHRMRDDILSIMHVHLDYPAGAKP